MGAVEIDRDENIEIAAETQSKNHTSDNLVGSKHYHTKMSD